MDANADIWQEAGQKLLRDNQLAMVYMGTWGADQLVAWVPEQAGKWRETKLPFNLYGWQNSSNFAIPSLSNNKEWAWKFIEYAVTVNAMEDLGTMIPAYLPARDQGNQVEVPNKFLGGQPTYRLHQDLASKMNEYVITPIDTEANAMWESIVDDGIQRNTPFLTVQETIERELGRQFGRDMRILLR